VRRLIILLFVAWVVAGCGSGGGGGFYDKQARDEAMRVAKKGPFPGKEQVVSVQSVHERDECAQAPPTGPCLDVAVTSQIPARDLSGNKVGVGVQVKGDFFIWLEKRSDGRWRVIRRTYRPGDVAVDGTPYVPSQ